MLASDVGSYNPPTLRWVVLGSNTKCNGLAQHAIYCPLWASQSTQFQGFHLGPPHSFILGSHAWPQNAYNMLATNTTYKALALDTRFRCGILQTVPEGGKTEKREERN
jgi:hypothetical protein